MKIEIEKEKNETIDWSKPQIFSYKHGNLIVISNGKHSDNTFQGIELHYGKFNGCYFAIEHIKEEFELYKGVLKLSNE